MSDGNPPSSWFDPPDDCPYEINSERIPNRYAVCERCGDPSFRNVEVRDMRIRYGVGTWIEVCERHYESVIEDFVKDIKNYEPNDDGD